MGIKFMKPEGKPEFPVALFQLSQERRVFVAPLNSGELKEMPGYKVSQRCYFYELDLVSQGALLNALELHQWDFELYPTEEIEITILDMRDFRKVGEA